MIHQWCESVVNTSLFRSPGSTCVLSIVSSTGPTGTLNLFCPDANPRSPGSQVLPNQPVHIVDLEMTPPTGRERLFVVSSRQPLPVKTEQLLGVANRGDPAAMRPNRASRDMKRVQESLEGLVPKDRHITVVGLDQLGTATPRS